MWSVWEEGVGVALRGGWRSAPCQGEHASRVGLWVAAVSSVQKRAVPQHRRTARGAWVHGGGKVHLQGCRCQSADGACKRATRHLRHGRYSDAKPHVWVKLQEKKSVEERLCDKPTYSVPCEVYVLHAPGLSCPKKTTDPTVHIRHHSERSHIVIRIFVACFVNEAQWFFACV